MAITTINLDVNDICTSKMGENIALTLEDGTIVTFTREALDEFIADYEYIQAEERAEEEAKEAYYDRLALQRLHKEYYSDSTYSVQSGKYLCGIDCAGEEKPDDIFAKLTIDAFHAAFSSPDIFLVDEDLLIDCPKEWRIKAFGRKKPLEW